MSTALDKSNAKRSLTLKATGVLQPSVVVKDPSVVSSMGEVFLIDGVYVNALGEEVTPSAAAHLPETPGACAAPDE
jgi:hypothetical protein